MYLRRQLPGVVLSEYADTAQSACDLGKGAHLPTTCTNGLSCVFCAEGRAEHTDAHGNGRCGPKGALPETTAVIAPKGWAELYGLDILEESIQDLKFNFTTFIAATV